MRCMLCGKETTGSIGAAGYFWKNLCQECKDKEDKALYEQVKQIGEAYAGIFQSKN